MIPFTDALDVNQFRLKAKYSWRTLQRMLEVMKDTSDLAVEYSEVSLAELLLLGSKYGDKAEGLKKNFVTLRGDYDRCIGSEIWSTVLQTDLTVSLAQLKPAEGAKYAPARSCLKGTREDLLKQVQEWAAAEEGHVLWINGAAGSGKSSLATSAALMLEESIGGYFFCKRDSKELRDAGRVLPTIAAKLARVCPPYGNLVAEALKTDWDLGSQSIEQQFEGLFRGPLGNLQGKGMAMPNYLVVIDALDECVDEDDTITQAEKRKDLVDCLCSFQSLSSWLKVLITSRPLMDIVQAFDKWDHTIWKQIKMSDASQVDNEKKKKKKKTPFLLLREGGEKKK